MTCPHIAYIIWLKVMDMKISNAVLSLILVSCIALVALPGCAKMQDNNRVSSYSLNNAVSQYRTGADPVTGRNQQVDLAWEQLCLATGYELQIAKDKDFTLRINPAVNRRRRSHLLPLPVQSFSTWIRPT